MADDLQEAEDALRDVIAGYEDSMAVLCRVRWRQGRTNPRAIWAELGPDWKAHVFLCCMPAAALAAEAVRSHNAALDRAVVSG